MRAVRWALVGTLLLAASGAPAASAAAPRAGDWEAKGSGTLRGSFAIVQLTRRVHKKPQRYLAVEDIAVDAPITCANAPSAPAPVEVDVLAGPTPVQPNGSFRTGTITRGTGTVVSGSLSGGRYTITYRHVATTPNRLDGGTETCDTRTVRLTASPGHRKAIQEGIWLGKATTGAVVQFNVAAGGRALVTPTQRAPAGQSYFAFQFESVGPSDMCPYRVPNALFIDPSGTFSNNEILFGDQEVFTGTFTNSKLASGTSQNTAQGCGSVTWNAKPGA